ncbi:ABC transporter substrate-binding protein [Staphylococcus hyicus]|uniref:Ferrichrome ABC transporter substrate-binding protein n=1 Tax=Staphylococcus hyicus TaxID=1284 RepID=A0A0A8HR78_STAHY|nr:ABC transporter substrate-binding protein [Staphylococcus hyicus]AJC95399.1 iron compound ABC transporter substrate-binding lipoprotein [Staphylococcus hyicus]MCE5153951.1 ABC transporter substrate-binding protein [Staphylococcus hyicus]MCQ9291405.1 ABC transporter substrate-binding protein [Staphylococcus hyicus]MCQ9300302.1 ABC transporter substrate-binding protein [Staphylococcus hyicus]MCQ9306646.1 ABC transporter substrate-binding protein [Staphylococcus hyicus]
MQKWFIPLVVFMLLLTACGPNKKEESAQSDEKTLALKTAEGKQNINIPQTPKRIVVLAPTYAGGLKYLDANIVGVSSQVDQSPILKKHFKDINKVGTDDVEKVASLKPDLIITYNTDKNTKKLEKIAPTLAINYAMYNYIEQQELLGQIMNKEKEVADWKEKWLKETKQDGKDIKQAIGEDATVSIIEDFEKKIYAYGKNWGRGSEVIYQAFGLKMPTELEKATQKEGWKEISKEDLETYSGDYIVKAKAPKAAQPEFTRTSMWSNLKPVKENHVFDVDSSIYWYNDPYSLDVIRKDLKEKFLRN